MHLGLVISVLLHVAILVLAVIQIRSTPPPRLPDPVPQTVEIVSASSEPMKGSLEAKEAEAQAKSSPKTQEAKKEPPKPVPPKPAVAPPPPPPPQIAEPPPPKLPEPVKEEPKKAEEPKKDPIAEKIAQSPPTPEPPPGPTPEDLKKIEEEKRAEEQKKLDEQKRIEAEKKAEAKRKADEAKKKAEEKRKRDEAKRLAEEKKKQEEAKRKAAEQKTFDQKIAEALNNPAAKAAEEEAQKKALVDHSKRKPAPLPSAPITTPSGVKGPVAGDPNAKGLSRAEQNALILAFTSQVKRCWRVLGGGVGADKTVVTLRIAFRQDGTVVGEPQVQGGDRSPFFMAAADSAKRAVLNCQPYDLPPDKYAAWKDVILDFDPQDMF